MSYPGSSSSNAFWAGDNAWRTVAGGGGAADGFNRIAAGTQTAGTNATIAFANSNGITFGMSGSTQVTASHNGLTTARASTDAVGLNTAQSNVTWTVNSSGLSFDGRGYAGTGTSATNASVTLNSNGLAISVAAPGGGAAATYSSTVVGFKNAWAQSSTSLGQNSVYFVPENFGDAVSAIAIKVPVLLTNSSIGSSSGQVGYTARLGIYSRNATNSTVLTQHYSTSYTLAVSNSSNASRAISIITGIGNSTSYNTASSSSAGLNLSSVVHGPREFILPLSSVLPAGDYWFAWAHSSSGAGTSNSVLAVSHIIASSQTGAKLGVATSATTAVGIAKDIGYGTYSTTTGALPAAVSMTQINKAATNPVFYLLNVTE